MSGPFKTFRDILGSKTTVKEPDFQIAFSIWAEKQAFHARLPKDKTQKITISTDQILKLMQEAYKAGYQRSKL